MVCKNTQIECCSNQMEIWLNFLKIKNKNKVKADKLQKFSTFVVFCLFVFILDQSRSCNHCNQVFPFQVEMCLEGEKTSFQKKTTQTSFPLMLQWIFFLLPNFFFIQRTIFQFHQLLTVEVCQLISKIKFFSLKKSDADPSQKKKKKACNKKLFLLI